MPTLKDLENGRLGEVKSLTLREELTEFPEAISDHADTLEYLDLSGNRLSKLPQSVGKLKKLKILFLSQNDFTSYPEILADCTNLDIVGFKSNKITIVPESSLALSLRWLILTDNKIKNLPSSIGQCKKLQKVMLAGNELYELPDAMQECIKIELIRLSANHFISFPEWLFRLPRLSWIAIGGNIATKLSTESISARLPDISWNDLQLNQTLGEGASGNISQAVWKRMDDQLKVAVKVFKGQVTSDGWPEDEMYTNIIASGHSSLVKVYGKIAGHPQQKQGLVLELISGEYKNLGLPPTFDSCTRDVFHEGTAWGVKAILHIAREIAAVCGQLHRNKVIHGDLYAHNILVNPDFHPLLGDFGAAGWYKNIREAEHKLLESIEVRAYGCLLDDLLKNVRTGEEQALLLKLQQLRNDCVSTDISTRPLFDHIEETIRTF